MPTAEAGFPDGGGVLGRDALSWYGPTIHVQMGFDASYRLVSPHSPNLPSQLLPALVDTGAAVSCIDSDLALQLRLPLIDQQQVAGVHGSQAVNVYLGQIFIPSLNWTIYGEFFGVHLQSGGQPHFALIGRTFLREFTLVYEGRTGTVTISND